MKLRQRIAKFFHPDPGSPFWVLVLPYAVLILLFIGVTFGGIHTWEYTNSPEFCGTACHTMPPQDTVYKESPHANVTCEECHIGRASFLDQAMRKTQGIKETYYEVFKLYEYPIRAKALRPSLDTCEKCHRPETFSDDSLRKIDHFASDRENTASSVYLIMKTGGGDAREGNARGIHWHITSKVLYYSDDELSQTIPYVRVYNEDGTFTEYTDIESGFDPTTIDESQLKQMDCVTCHNRVTHNFKEPSKSVDESMSSGLIDPSIPFIRQKAVEALSTEYATRDEAMKAIAGIEDEYKRNLFDVYSQNGEKIQQAIVEIQAIYDRTVFHDQKIDWKTYPNNLGHIDAPGCFRCHDGKHLNAENEAVRLECNVCHAVPVTANADDFVTRIEISRGPEPETHLNPNWISMHNQTLGPSCTNCHNTKDPGGTSNTSFCSNSACHGNVFTYAGFDAPALREIIQSQLPPPEPALEVPALTGDPTYENYIGALFTVKCTGCHTEGDAAPEGLDLSTYAAIMKGSENGPVIIAGDSTNSLLVQIQSADHFANFTLDELNNVINWIIAGAPEN
ncbi:MAG TPA: NapC/NirT family cytochrome c [Anaerolineales bacterium]|nr:NapC/NirT family cytochrome c [Anaerolineales bacterium]HNB37122.1 NapC/NirT family cytochrome c [Anaerolineales bacterium]HNC08943.1 NapC/NirT family cytochrome c [Anaerolineales bacterium]